MKVAIVENIAPLYRLLLWQKLSQVTEPEYTFFSAKEKLNGIEIIDPLLFTVPIVNGGIRWNSLKNIVISKRVIWQRGVIRLALTGDFSIFIFLDEMQIISTWLVFFMCKLRKKKIVFWGHGLYGNEGIIKKLVRLFFYRLPDAHLLYNERAKRLLIKNNIKKNSLFVVHNSLNYDQHLMLRKVITQKEIYELKNKLFSYNNPVVVFIGRLTREKKIDQLLKSVYQLHKIGHQVNCLIIGGGETLSELKEQVQSFQLTDYICFYGSCYDEYQNALLISLSDCCVSPGNVGLTAIHCMSFGTPVISHNQLSYQGPEVSAIIEDRTGELFEKDNIDSLTQKINEVVFVKKKNHYYKNCIDEIDTYYNPYHQVKVFQELIDYLKENK